MPNIAFAGLLIPIRTGPERLIAADLLDDADVSVIAKQRLRAMLDSGAIASTAHAPSMVSANQNGVILSALKDAVRGTFAPSKSATRHTAWWGCADATGKHFWMTSSLPHSSARMLTVLAAAMPTTRELQQQLGIADAPARLREMRAMGIRVALVRVVGAGEPVEDAEDGEDVERAEDGGAEQPQATPRPAPRLLLLSEVRFEAPPPRASVVAASEIEQRARGLDAWGAQIERDGRRAGRKQGRQLSKVVGLPAGHPAARAAGERVEQEITAAVQAATTAQVRRLQRIEKMQQIALDLVEAAARRAKGDADVFTVQMGRALVRVHLDYAMLAVLAVTARIAPRLTAPLTEHVELARLLNAPGLNVPALTREQWGAMLAPLLRSSGHKDWSALTAAWIAPALARAMEREARKARAEARQ